jgi:RNA polymerase sigma factor (sigma-70 family)
MLAKKRKNPLFLRRRKAHRTSLPAGEALTDQQLEELWTAYAADHADVQLRNRLVEHYAPSVYEMAARIARKMKLRDADNAVGDVLSALVTTIIPGYDGYSGFDRWARVCARRKMVDQLREQQTTMSIFPEEPCGCNRRFVPEHVPDRMTPNYDLDFLAITAGLSDEEAIVLWLRHYRGMPVGAVAALLKVSAITVKTWMHAAVLQLRKKEANYPWEDLPMRF